MTSHIDLTYVTRHTPFWGNVTSTLDWCEYNYQFSPYIAELANTVSNIFIITLSVYGYWRCKQESLPSLLRNDYLFILLVGLGSAAFHGSLLYEAQLADELPMVLSATHASFVLFQTAPGQKNPQRTKNLAIFGIIVDIVFALSYSLVYRDPTYHQAFFASVLFLNAYRVMTLRRQKIAPLSEDLQAQVVKLFWSGGSSFVFAFLIWNIDNIFCGYIRQWKNIIGWPAAFLLEGHSWWHLFTGFGSYLMAVGQHYLVLSVEEGESSFKIEYNFGLPHIVRTKTKRL